MPEEFLDLRLSGEVDEKPLRLPARRDRDRILYSTEFRRLAGVTQVASATENLLIHNRITHSTKVEQVAASIVAEHDAGLPDGDPEQKMFGASAEWRAAAAGLGHDLGHPPFGHIGEQALNAILVCEDHLKNPRPSKYSTIGTASKRRVKSCTKCLLEDGFEGNAQSFRIVTKLTARAIRGTSNSPAPEEKYRRGLDLTRGSLRALSKYPWLRGDCTDYPHKWGAYDCDARELAWTFADSGAFNPANILAKANGKEVHKSREAQIMDWADDITYAVHDLDDFFRLGLVPLQQLRLPSTEDSRAFMNYVSARVSADKYAGSGYSAEQLRQAVESRFAMFPERAFEGSPEDVARLGGLVSDLIQYFVGATKDTPTAVSATPPVQYVNAVLKQLTWYFVIDNPALASIQEGQRRLLTNLFEYVRSLAADSYKEDGDVTAQAVRRLPALLRYYVDGVMRDEGCQDAYTFDQRLTRGVVDFIAGLTDRGAYELHRRLTGDGNTSILDAAVAV